jgi:IS30 family transposase
MVGTLKAKADITGTRAVVTALIKQAKKLPKELYKSLTWDRGKELTAHRRAVPSVFLGNCL